MPLSVEHVRTGPTTRAELDRLLADALEDEVSGIRALGSAPTGALARLRQFLSVSASR